MQCCNSFGCNLGEDKHHNSQQYGRNGNARVAVKADGDNGRDSRGQNVNEIIANEDETNQSIGPFKQLAGSAGSPMALGAEVFQTISVERHHAGFGTGKETRNQYQYGENEKKQSQRGVVQEAVVLRQG